MKLEYKSNLYGGLVSLIFGIVLYLIIPLQIAVDLFAVGTITSRTIPYIISIIFMLCGVSLVIKSIVLKKDDIKVIDLKKEFRILLYILCLVIYAVVLKYNFLISTCALTTVTLAFQKCKNKKYYAISIVVVIVLTLIFKELLNVRLP